MRLFIITSINGNFHSIDIRLMTEYAIEKYRVTLGHNAKDMRRLCTRTHLPDIRIL